MKGHYAVLKEYLHDPEAAEKQNPWLKKVLVTRIVPVHDESNLRALVTIYIDNLMAIKRIRVIQQPTARPYISMPQVREEKFWNTLITLTDAQLEAAIIAKVLAAWEKGEVDNVTT